MAKGIAFSAPMVIANREGRKRQTRRIMKPQPVGEPASLEEWASGLAVACGVTPSSAERAAKVERLRGRVFPFRSPEIKSLYSPTPRYQPGDVVYVKETWAPIPEARPSGYFTDPKWIGRKAWYRTENDKPTWGGNWRSPLFMPAWAARDWIKIKTVRVERLQEISEADALAEGIIELEQGPPMERFWASDDADEGHHSARNAYIELIESIYGHGTWESNPFVWVYEFEKAEAARG